MVLLDDTTLALRDPHEKAAPPINIELSDVTQLMAYWAQLETFCGTVCISHIFQTITRDTQKG